MDSRTTSVGEEYMLGHTFQESTRLHMQNWMFKERFGYVLHPSIPTTSASLEVADICCGNGNWLLDLAEIVPSGWKLYGFDIARENFPAKDFLPENISFHVQDAFEEPPTDLIEKFDIVHIRAFVLLVKGGDPNPLFSNLIKMLKPGGYIQLDDADPERGYSLAPNPTISSHCTDRLFILWRNIAKKLGLEYSWAANKAPILRDKHNLEIIAAHRYGPTDKLRKPATDDWLMAIDQMCCTVMRRGGEVGELVDPGTYIELMKGVEQEVIQGVMVWIDLMVVVARKPQPRVEKL
ncbi:MAG: hypothetical protein LQ338_004909 [Usnochroma carphineum]|nr:MAG: hypothetical protein LQ338_004909 [Usnochroma carphineum]